MKIASPTNHHEVTLRPNEESVRRPSSKRSFPILTLSAALTFLAISPVAQAGEPASPVLQDAKPALGDLTLANFFFAGWNEPWTRRSRGDGTPDMSLLRVQTNFLTDVLRLDYAYQDNLTDSLTRGTHAATATLEYAFNRRIELALVGYYNWIDSRAGTDTDGGTEGAFIRMQWVDTATSSLATNLRVTLPNRDLGGKDTTVSLAIAGWQDLAPLGLKRTGLYYHVQEETLAGPRKVGGVRNDLTYAISLARTWTSSESFFGNATTFVEAYGKTNLDGTDKGDTLVTITPGIRATIAHRHVLMAGVEFPLTEPRPYERILRLTYIYSF